MAREKAGGLRWSEAERPCSECEKWSNAGGGSSWEVLRSGSLLTFLVVRSLDFVLG